ncbi:ribonuclease H-like domain-containing protein [Mycena rosella]|uniref:3'-5' exonuclease n=1 Tax=Mycena rosella TaxID=1033263 RepID=A0AAD7GHZ9_MYCRO|nr:ribonuclease H-like domain-containing protein [Mycena rosella]
MSDLRYPPTAIMVSVLPAYAQKGIFCYIANKYEADNALRSVKYGEIRFDTEYTDLTPEQLKVKLLAGDSRLVWDAMKISVVQIAVPRCVYIIDLKAMRAVPEELARIVRSEDINKAGVGLANDAKVIWDSLGMEARRFVEVGMMAKFANPEWYSKEGQNPLSLEQCVHNYLEQILDKTKQKAFRWGKSLTKEQIIYAGLDAQASLEVYRVISRNLRQKQRQLGRAIPEDWYTFNYRVGEPTRLEATVRGEYLHWSP